MKQTLSLRFSHWLFVIICMTVGISAAPGVPPHNWEGQIHLRHGDRLSGRIEAIMDDGSTLVLRHPLLTDPLLIESAAVARFEVFDPPGIRLPRHWQVDLVNGDRLDARDWELTRDGLTLETDSAGRVTVPRAGVRSLTRMSGETPLLDGPGQPDDWTTTNNAVLKLAPSGGLSLRWGAISREISPMPDAFRLDLSIRYAGSPNWSLWFHAEDAGLMREMSACLLSRNMNRFAFLIKRYKGGEANWGGPVSATVNPTSAGRHGQPVSENVTLFFDRSRRSLRIFLNGEALGSSLKIPPFESFGNFLTLHPQDSNNVELRDIRLSPLTELPPDMADQEGARDSDMIWLRGEKRIKGNIDLPETGAWRVRDASSGREIAKDEILGIAFARSGDSRARVRGEALVALRDGSRLTMRLTGIDEENMSGESTLAGHIQILLKDVVSIDWGGAVIGPETRDEMGRVSLLNGDVLLGNNLKMEKGSHKLRFRHPAIREELTFGPDALDTYHTGRDLEWKASVWQVDDIKGGEWLTGEDLRLEGDNLTLWNRHVGKIIFSRWQDLGLTYTKNSPVLLRGLNASGWKFWSKGDPPFSKETSSVLLGPPNTIFISRELPPLPEKFKIEIEISYKAKSSALSVLFAASEPHSSSNGVKTEFFFEKNVLSLKYWINIHGSPQMMSFKYELSSSPPGGEKKRYTFFTDLSKQIMWVYVEGKQVAVWEPIFVPPNPGTYFTLANTYGQQENAVLISDLIVAEWDGVLPGEVRAGEIAKENDLLLLSNLDEIQGKVQSLDDGKVNLQLEDVALEIPLERFKTIRLAEKGPGHTGVDSDVTLTLIDGSLLRMGFTDMEMDGAVFTGVSPVYGPVRVPMDSIRTIRWDNQSR
ncbi:MAG: hypothetical protein ACO3N7_01125 [Kiritimatiellia bacterium]